MYLSPAINPKQSVSGTLSYALGCGRPVIATKTEYAKHIVRNGKNGILVEFKNPRQIAKALTSLLSNQKLLSSMKQEAYERTRHMTWPNVATSYFNLFKQFAPLERWVVALPALKLDYLRRLTDSFGILHHSRYTNPQKRYGYTLDDNARALLVTATLSRQNPTPGILKLFETYLRFIQFTMRKDGTFISFVSSNRRARLPSTDEDAHGRTIWALGHAASSRASFPEETARLVEYLFRRSLEGASRFTSPRAAAFAMTGMYHYLKQFPERKTVFRSFVRLAHYQLKLWNDNSSPDWLWFEDQLTYSNSKLPESLLYAYDLTGEKPYLDAAEKSLEFLHTITFGPTYYNPIGQKGWYIRTKERAYFDQQPEDAASMVKTKIAAYKITGRRQYLRDAYIAFQWFLGKNHLCQMVYDELTGGCCDGLGKNSLNLNQGAESTLSYLLSRLAFDDPRIANVLPSILLHERR